MKIMPSLLLFAVYFYAGAESLRAADNDLTDVDIQLQAAFDRFPLLMPATNSAGQLAFQNLSLRNPVVVDGTNYFGFRFTVPSRANREDFIWAFVNPANNVQWQILPRAGTMLHFGSYVGANKDDYLNTEGLRPLRRKRLILQPLSGEALHDGETYLIWFVFRGEPPQVPVAFTFAKITPGTAGEPGALEKALTLERAASPPMVNPGNGHTYILLKAATWRESEAKAVGLGGHLATVRNQAEQDWLLQTFGSYGGIQRLLWIGLNDTEKKFHFGWSSRESASYTAWAKSEPNNADRGETFVAIFYPDHDQGGKWNDWDDRRTDPIGLPMNGVVEIVPTPGTMPGRAAAERGRPATDSAGAQAAVEIRPALVITNEARSIKLQWSIAASDYMLEVTTNLAQPFTMFGYSEATNAEAAFVHVTITNPVPQMYFRLRKP
jgi:hypothetical protein